MIYFPMVMLYVSWYVGGLGVLPLVIVFYIVIM